jgi:hypothetical protein
MGRDAQDDFVDAINEAIKESDSAAGDFENCGDCGYGDVPNGLINFQRNVGRGQVAIVRAQIELMKAQAALERMKQGR